MTELEFKFYTALQFSSKALDQVFGLRCLPMQDEVQLLQSFGVQLTPAVGYELQRDGFGSWVVCGSCRAPHRRFIYVSHGIVQVDLSRRAPLNPARDINPALCQPTALTCPDRAVLALWNSLPLEGRFLREQALLLNQAAHDSLTYTPGVTSNATTAAQALAQGKGVCQDYTHLLLALARQSGFAARYCMGLIPGEGATHAWAELALPEGWLGLDPTHGCEAGESHVRFAAGRDAADCPVEQGVMRGGGEQDMEINMQLRPRIQAS